MYYLMNKSFDPDSLSFRFNHLSLDNKLHMYLIYFDSLKSLYLYFGSQLLR